METVVAAAEQLSITLPADMARVIRAKVEGGGYASNSDVIREAMRAWIDRERSLAALDAAIDQGVAEADAGLGRDVGEVRRALRSRYAGTDVQDAR